VARQVVRIVSQVDGFPVRVQVFEFPIIEDLVSRLVNEASFARKLQEPISRQSPFTRDIKDFLIKSTVGS
jgi:hypothetical protein